MSFFSIKRLEKGGGFRTASRSGWMTSSPAAIAPYAQSCIKQRSFDELPLCPSRACLGKMIDHFY
jgi:hypothetical protein